MKSNLLTSKGESKYIAPEIELYTTFVERGFASSDVTGSIYPWEDDNDDSLYF